MPRTLQQAINELHVTQNLYDRTTMDIGQLYADLNRTKDEKLQIQINDKLEVLVKLEQRLQRN
jgi:hypothetical protein